MVNTESRDGENEVEIVANEIDIFVLMVLNWLNYVEN